MENRKSILLILIWTYYFKISSDEHSYNRGYMIHYVVQEFIIIASNYPTKCYSIIESRCYVTTSVREIINSGFFFLSVSIISKENIYIYWNWSWECSDFSQKANPTTVLSRDTVWRGSCGNLQHSMNPFKIFHMGNRGQRTSLFSSLEFTLGAVFFFQGYSTLVSGLIQINNTLTFFWRRLCSLSETSCLILLLVKICIDSFKNTWEHVLFFLFFFFFFPMKSLV